MTGGKKGKGKGAQDTAGDDSHCAEQAEDDMQGDEGQHGGDSTPGTVRTGLKAINKQISELKSELKEDLKTFKDEIKSDMSEELKQDVNRQLATNKPCRSTTSKSTRWRSGSTTP